ncbi:VWA domain-containing protein [Candidatus Sulfurimonas marisnigri]|uniref:VWA domain-containing protein n=1 Tax=Candidatus Sulfurimonas marisnigri TaxID=2740405 RepID=A0A7S7RR81_9BACT|nr:VWA domain-containing protein [Candidatus Sulfurimonas marisnigri]QOY55481.1 VWA domain-containing protein [Candidatus Sulfurimonas marisnigri]
MEESIGKVWNKFLNKKTSKSHNESQVFFTDKSKSLKIFYHLLGGEKGKELQVTDKRFIDTSRSFLEKISGAGDTFFLANQDEKGVYLPASLAYFPTKEQNEMLYFWLIAQATKVDANRGSHEDKNLIASQILLKTYPGFKNFYETATDYLNLKYGETYPSPMWIYPSLSGKNKYSDFEDEEEAVRGEEKPNKTDTLKMKKQANQIDDKKETDGLLAFLPDSLMSIMEQVNVDRSEDDSFDEDALYNAEDLDEITLGRKKANLSARLKMDLDLTTNSSEEYPLGKGHYIDEWDYSKEVYLKNYVCIKPIITPNTEPIPLPKRLQNMVKKIQSELDLMELERIKNNKLPYGDEINIDTWIDYKGHQNKSGHHQKFYESFIRKTRDMSTLILADISLSTEAGITQEIRIIDMIKDGLMVFSESLERLQDRFAIYAFSSIKNKNVRFHIIKNFKEKYSNLIRGRIDSIKPGYYTRLGAAIRESGKILNKQQSQNKLLLIISDGKPNDVDRYDGRYGIEDTKKAIQEVKKLGITPFCITIDLEAKDYLSYLFGKNGYVVVRDSKKLPKVLPEIYMNLTK